MRVSDLVVEVRTADLVRVGQVDEDDLVGATFTPRFNDVGQWTLTLPALRRDGTEHLECAALREEGAGIIVTGPGGVIISGKWLTANWQADARNLGGVWVFEGLSDLEEIDSALAFPQPSNPNPSTQTVSNDVRTAPTENLLHQYVNANRGPGAPVARRSPRLEMGPNLGRGPTRTRSPRFQNLLTLCQEITSDTNIGFDVVQDDDELRFVTKEASDLSALIRWDIDNDQLTRAKNQRIAPTVTHAIVAGQGEGIERTIVLRSSTESDAAAAVWGRREQFIDQRQTDILEELQERGDTEIAQRGTLTSAYQVTPAPDVVDRFGVEWNIGDIITAVIGDEEIPIRVTGAAISVTSQGLIVAAILGDPDELDPESTQLRRTAARVSQLERNAEAGALPVGTHLAGEWSTGAVPVGFVLANGAVLNIADYPKLAAHYTAVYGSANFHGGNGTTTFAVPDTRERVYVNQGGSDIFAAIGAKLGAKTHSHPLSAAGWAEIILSIGAGVFQRRVTGSPGWTATHRTTATTAADSTSAGSGAALGGSTDGASSVQPSFVCRYIVRAA